MIKYALTSLILMTASAHSAVVITEVLFNESGSDTSGEWIEIYNNGAVLVSLTDWKIGDEETSGQLSATEGMFTFPAGSSIGPGMVQIVAVNANRFQALYGFLPAYEVGTGASGDNAATPNLTVYATWDPDVAATNTINLSNSNDQVLLLNAGDTMVDVVNWGNTFSLNPGLDDTLEADGQSWYRIDQNGPGSSASDWALTPGGVQASTPGVVPEPSVTLFAGLAGGLGFLGLSRRRH